MQQVVSITSQGQITIPSSFRRLLNLNQYPKAIIKVSHNQLTIKPMQDVLSLAGIISHKAKRGQTIQQTISQENKAISASILQKHIDKK